MPELITAKTLKKAFADQRAGGRYDVSDSRVAGLQLRVKPLSVRWTLRVRLHGDQRRYDLGPAAAGDENVGGLSIDGARARGMRVIEMARHNQNPATYLSAIATGVSMETRIRLDAARPKPSWTWEAAKTAFLAEVKRSRREDTHRDYSGKLRPAELACFDGRMVNTITRNEMAAAIAAVHLRGAEAMSEGMVRVIKRLWSWLAEAVRQDETSVADGVMIKLKAPPRTRLEIGEAAFDPDNEVGDAPPEIEIGRALAIARLGCLPERIGLGIQLLIGTAQRRRAVTGAHRGRFRNYLEAADEAAWYVPPYFRKSGTKRGRRSHLVPCVGFAAVAADRLDLMSDFAGSDGWLFPAGRSTRSGRPHAEAGLFNDYLCAMPGVSFSPHGVRYAFATYGERDLRFKPAEAGIILDHLEGVEPNDVTGQFYSSDPQIARKRQMMRAWTDWCDEWAAQAISDDRALLDRELMTA
jgi:integrase